MCLSAGNQKELARSCRLAAAGLSHQRQGAMFHSRAGDTDHLLLQRVAVAEHNLPGLQRNLLAGQTSARFSRLTNGHSNSRLSMAEHRQIKTGQTSRTQCISTIRQDAGRR